MREYKDQKVAELHPSQVCDSELLPSNLESLQKM